MGGQTTEGAIKHNESMSAPEGGTSARGNGKRQQDHKKAQYIDFNTINDVSIETDEQNEYRD